MFTTSVLLWYNGLKGKKQTMWKKIKYFLDKFSPWACLIVSACQFFESGFMGGIGWLMAGVMWWLEEEGERNFKELAQLFREHLDNDKKNEDELKENMFNPDLKNVDHMDIDHILKIGRDFQNSDKWHGATYDTAKLLCDTIENLRKNGEKKHEVF